MSTLAGLVVLLLVVAGVAATPLAAPVGAVPPTLPERSRAGWQWPLHPRPDVVADFERHTRYGPGHRGVDLGAEAGQEVRAAADGVVSFAGQVAGRPVVVVTHRGGLRTTYEPVLPSVSRGDAVRSGGVLGVAAATGHCTRTCVHWGLRRGHGTAQVYLDPVLWLRRPASPRLLPLGAGGSRGLPVSAGVGELVAHLEYGLGVHLADP